MIAFLLAAVLGAQPQAALQGATGYSIEVNIPAGRLDLYRGGKLEARYPVSPGFYPYVTPIGDFAIRRIVWNPWWTPPESKWARGRKKTPPGPRNPMGRVKLLLTEDIYIHGTHEEGKLGRPASHGCIRMANRHALALARRLAAASATLPAGTIARLEAQPSRTHEATVPAVPVRIRYDRAEFLGDSLFVYPDLYGRGPNAVVAVRRAWARLARPPEGLDLDALEPLLPRDPRARLVLNLGSPPPPAEPHITVPVRVLAPPSPLVPPR